MGSTLARFIADGQLPKVSGELDISNSDELARWLVSFGPGLLNVDFSAVEFIDASTVRTLLQVQRLNPQLRITNPSRRVQRVLDLTQTAAALTNHSQQAKQPRRVVHHELTDTRSEPKRSATPGTASVEQPMVL